jgi:hypothetical protein
MPVEVLTDTERRTLANLSIPRSVANLHHELRIDPHTSEPQDERAMAKLLDELQARGWVKNLGEHDDAAHMIARAQDLKSVMDIPDEKAQLFSVRLQRDDQAWRLRGDQWMLTNEGVAKLHEPVDERPRLTTSELESLIATQAKYIVDHPLEGSIHDQAKDVGPARAGGRLIDPQTGEPYTGDLGPRLLGVAGYWNGREDRPLPWMLEEEFTHWVKLVTDDHEAAWGERPRLPQIGGAGWTDLYENTIIDAENQKATITSAAPWYMCLSILAFTDADTGTTADDGTHKPTYTGYARKSVAAADMNSAAAGSAANANAIIFAACTAGTSNIVAFGNCDAATVGLLRKYGTCATTTVSTTQTPAQFAAGAYSSSAD